MQINGRKIGVGWREVEKEGDDGRTIQTKEILDWIIAIGEEQDSVPRVLNSPGRECSMSFDSMQTSFFSLFEWSTRLSSSRFLRSEVVKSRN